MLERPFVHSSLEEPGSSFPVRYPSELPITSKRQEILDALKNHQVVVITGETGSGKSTQIPKMCLEAGLGASGWIGCTQPRRIAAVTLANRVAEELGGAGPALVGYKIRFRDRTRRSNRIKFMTDGILLAEAQTDRLFRSYGAIVVDEAHERSLNIDFLLGMLKGVLPKRPDLRVVITSATINPEKFSQAFGSAPIVEVSGRTFPVQVIYRPVSAPDEDPEEVTHIDQTLASIQEIQSITRPGDDGDTLVFMPTESDIRETVQRLEELRLRNTLVMPLFGRMAAPDQRKIFESTPQHKIIVATNIAETSITIPGVRYVVDTGLARISQYNAGSGTQGLPVVPVSRASADQRKGRCGRLGPGICFRLYSEEDYLSRPPYTLPEIQRANLAEVILRMLFLRLEDIREFPFLDPPSPGAVRDAFSVLRELGAVDDRRRLTPSGRIMARLPLDPRMARMLVQANTEGALREMVILASVLSIQDPRERPLEKEAAADQKHAAFRDPRSDFVTFLKIWGASLRAEAPTPENPPEAFEPGDPFLLQEGTTPVAPPQESDVEAREATLPGGAPPEKKVGSRSASRLRKFCRENYLSYLRMREWRDVHDEIRDLLEEMKGFRINERPASYEGIHRAVLSGYLSHLAVRKEKNLYMGPRNRRLTIFPGSALFGKGGSWIVSADVVRTSRLYARHVATIEPQWAEELGKHLCRSSYSEPHWEKDRGQVAAYERVTLYGLPIVERRKVNYHRVNPREARSIFIRSALMTGEIRERHGFLEHNGKLIEQIRELENMTRRRDLLAEEEKIYEFYDSRLPDFADARSLARFVKEGGDALLRMKEEDLLQAPVDLEVMEQYPKFLASRDVRLPLRYAFQPGESEDGVTVSIPSHLLPRLRPEVFPWLVPGMLREKVTALFKALPKAVRRGLVPLAGTVERVIPCLAFGEGDFFEELSRCVQKVAGVRISPDQWSREALPDHLQMRFELLDPQGRIMAAGRDLPPLVSGLLGEAPDHAWDTARRRWEREGLVSWDFGDLPREIEIGTDSLGNPQYAYPMLVAEEKGVALRLCRDPIQARRETRRGLLRLVEEAFASELKQLKRQWAFPDHMNAAVFFMGGRTQADRKLREFILREIFELRDPQWPDRSEFLRRVDRAKGHLAQMGGGLWEEVLGVVQQRSLAQSELRRFLAMGRGNAAVQERLSLLLGELEELLPGDFLDRYGASCLRHMSRYLRALTLRAERAYAAPEKDRLKSESLETHRARYRKMLEYLQDRQRDLPSLQQFLEDFRWMLEEYKVSLFAPEVRTRLRVSPRRLEEKWLEWNTLKESAHESSLAG